MNFNFLCVVASAVLFVQSLFGQEPSPTAEPDSSKDAKSEQDKRPRQSATPCGRWVEVCEVVDQYAALTQKRIIRDNFVQGKMIIDDLTGVAKEKAIEFIERSLFSDGYTLVQIDPETIQVVGAGQNPRSIGIPVVSEAKAVPRQERVISYVFRFKHRRAVEMQQMLGQYLSPPRAYTSALAEPQGNTLLVTERTSVIRALIKIVAEMDIPAPKDAPPEGH